MPAPRRKATRTARPRKNRTPSRREIKLGLLPEVARIFNARLDPNEILQLVLEEAVKNMRASGGSLCLINPDTGELEIEVSIGLPAKAKKLKLPLGRGITGWVALHGKPACVRDVSKDSRYVAVTPGIRSELAVPLEVEGNVVGVLNVDSAAKNHFTQDDQDLLVALASQSSKLIQNAWLYAQVNHKADQLSILFQIAESILGENTVDDILSRITQETCKLISVARCSLFLLDAKEGVLTLHSQHGGAPGQDPRMQLSVEDSQLGTAVNSRKPVFVSNIQKSDTVVHREMARMDGLVSMLAVPLLAAQEVLGVLSVYTRTPHRFSNDEIKLLATLANYSAIAIQRTRFHEQILRAEERLRHTERLSTLGILAAEFSHEIRNPLTVMKMLLHSLSKTVQESPEGRKDLDIIIQKTEQLNQTIERVLRLARHSEPKLEHLDLNDLVSEVIQLTRHHFRQHNIQVECELTKEAPVISGDRVQLEQAILNLLLNASQALEEDRRIFLRTGSASRCLVEIRDTGRGIPNDKKGRLFEPFVSPKEGGTGLGLPIVKKIVEQHGGEVQWESTNRGTTFRLIFPAAADIHKSPA